MAGLLDSLFSPSTYSGSGGLLDRLLPMIGGIPQSQGFQQDQAAPMQIGSYQMPRIGNPDQFVPQQAMTPPNAQPTQGMAPQSDQQQLPPALGGNSFAGNFGAGLQSFANTPGGLLPKLVGGISAGLTGQRTDPAGLAQQNLKAQYDSLVPVLGPQKALLAVMNPEAGKTLLNEALTNKEKFQKVGQDPATGIDQYGFVNEREQTINGKPLSQAATAQNSNMLGDTNLTGDAYLQSLPESIRSQVKAIVEGRMQPPSGFALKSPQIQYLLRAAAQYEPGFDLTKWGARAATAKDFASGQAAKNVTSLNTVVGHLNDLKDKADALDNGGIPLFNEVGNYFNSATGGAKVNNFNLARNAVADELAKVFKGSGISDHEIEQWKGALNAAQSPEQLKGAVKTAIGLMDSRLSALNDQRDRGMSTQSEPRSLLNEKSRKALEAVDQWASGGTKETKGGGISEGMTATNPQTGQKIMFKGGKWVPAQ